VDSVNEALVMPTNRAAKRDSKRRARRTREERSEEIRQNLIQAGARTVGRYGYEKASVARITSRAKVALGTFYRHFHSRQEFFDQLLPAMGDRLMAFIQSKVAEGARSGFRGASVQCARGRSQSLDARRYHSDGGAQ
jgi:AcrR family transcriptional regulator